MSTERVLAKVVRARDGPARPAPVGWLAGADDASARVGQGDDLVHELMPSLLTRRVAVALALEPLDLVEPLAMVARGQLTGSEAE